MSAGSLPGAGGTFPRRTPERRRDGREGARFAGVTVRHDTVPGVGHNGFKVIDAVQAFFADALQGANPAA